VSLNPMSDADPKRPPPLISIVDDDEGVRIALKALISARGWRAEVFASGDDYLASTCPGEGCLLLDLHMPGKSGADVLATLRQQGQHVVAVVMTAHPKSVLLDRVRALGIKQVLLKPFDEHELDAKLNAALAAGAARRQ
jgi:FixJ family two-component response regulator